MFKIHKKKKGKKKYSTEFIGESGFTYPFGYVDTDAYIFLGKGRPVRAIFDIVFAYGTNRPDNIGWVNKVIPRYYIESGKVIFVQRQKGIPKETEDKIFQSSLPSNVKTMSNSTTKILEKMLKTALELLILNYRQVCPKVIQLLILI